MRLPMILAAWAFALSAHAAVLPVTPATLAAVDAKALPGDVLSLAPGLYGDYTFRKTRAPAITVTSADPAHPATFRTFNVINGGGVHADHLLIAFTPDAKTVSNTAAMWIVAATDISITASKIVGGPSINGVAETASVGDSTGNIIGRPAGEALNLTQVNGLVLDGNDISQFDRLIIFSNLQNAKITRNALHDRRRTAIGGAQASNLTIDHNIISAASPWRYNQTPVGDHADCIAIWSNGGQATPNDNVQITNNLMQQTAGASILGMWTTGNTVAPFTNLLIAGNTLLIPNLQGISLTYTTSGEIKDNVLIQANVAGVDPKQRPTILLRAGVTGVAMTGNQVSAPISDLSGGVNPVSGTTLLAGTYVADGAGATGAAAPDLRDAQIASLNAQVASLTQQIADAKAAGVADLNQIATLQGQLASAQSTLAAAQAALDADETRLAAVRAAVAP